MKVLIIGSNGMLGHDLVNILSKENDIITTTHDTLDITDIKKTILTIEEIKPDIVINSAAYTAVDAAESNEDLAYHVNVLGTRNIAVACQKIGAALVYICTDYVFDGTKGESYREYDTTNPLSVYGKTKYLGEVYIRDLLDKFYIVRTSWLYGYNGPNFITTMLNLAKNHDSLNVVSDQIGCPTYTVDLAIAINELIKEPNYGIYHITNSDSCSWYEFALEIFKNAGIEINVNPVTTEEYGSPAPRPKYSVLENYNWKMQGHKELRSYKNALKAFMDSLDK